MKYLKYTCIAFIASLALSCAGVNALVVGLYNVQIPILGNIWTSGIETKQNWGIQEVMKTDATDNVSGDGRVILARTYEMTGGGNYSSWITVPKGSWANWGNYNADKDQYRLQLKSQKNLITTASFYGNWSIN
ncbi:MAG: hypothetical protein KH135_03160 [Firmicutes bacterium]|nr:hypothetical protein [Bacillota bacterium]